MKIHLSAIFIVLSVTPAVAQRGRAAAPAPAGWTAFVQAFDGYVARDSVVGASILVLKDGIVTARHDVGWGDRAAGQRADTNTIYHWGSITKTLTAVAVMQLRDRGKLSLDDRITRYVPDLKQVSNPFGAMDDITLQLLLSHSSGLQDPTWPWRHYEAWEPFEPTKWEQLVAMMPYQRLRFAPGSQYGYSNPGFLYLAHAVEQITGEAWQSYIYKNVFGPLGLTRSYFSTTPYYLSANRSNNYDLVKDSTGPEHLVANGRDFDPGVTIPNGGWNAPLGDLVRWVRFLSGTVGEDSAVARRYPVVLTRTSLDEMWRARLPVPDSLGKVAATADSMGMSFFILWRHGARFVGHTGTQAGFRSFFYINPVTHAAVIAVYNTSNDVRDTESASGFRAVRDSALSLIAH